MDNERVQLHLTQPYKIEIRNHHRVRPLLLRGWRIVQLQRITDEEVLVTLEAPSAPTPADVHAS